MNKQNKNINEHYIMDGEGKKYNIYRTMQHFDIEEEIKHEDEKIEAAEAICNALGIDVISTNTNQPLVYNKEELLNPPFLVINSEGWI